MIFILFYVFFYFLGLLKFLCVTKLEWKNFSASHTTRDQRMLPGGQITKKTRTGSSCRMMTQHGFLMTYKVSMLFMCDFTSVSYLTLNLENCGVF